MTVGEYDIVMETGPGFASRRQESLETMLALLPADPNLMAQAGDLIFRNMDFHGADIIADRLAAANPLAQIDEKSNVPPQAQMMIKQSQATIEQLQQELQALQMDMKYRASIEQQKQEAETQRKTMDVQARMEDSRLRTDTQANDTVIESQTKLEIEQMKAQLALILANMDIKSEKVVLDEAIERGI
jgi:TolA-binding protein